MTVLARLESRREQVVHKIERVRNQTERMGFVSKAADAAIDELHHDLTEIDRAIHEFHLEFDSDGRDDDTVD